MAAGRKAAFTALGALLGAILGGIVGLGIGLAYVEVANVPSFEGRSGFAVAYWILFGILGGLVSGALVGARRA